MKKIIIAGRAHPYVQDFFLEKEYAIVGGVHFEYNDVWQYIDDAEGLIVASQLKVDKPLLEKAHQLKWIGRLGSGMELIDTPFAGSKGIACFSSPEGNSTAVAEHCLGLLLNLMNNISSAHNEVRQGIWERNKNRGIELEGKTIGIIGYGNTGSRLATLLTAFGTTILVYDKYKYGFAVNNIKEASLEQIARYADVVSLHVPLTTETFHMADAVFFDSLQRSPILLNASRGKVVDMAALIPALINGHIAAAGLDVLENEQLNSYTPQEQQQLDQLLAMPNVIITPHIAGYTHEALYKMATVLLQKLETVL